MCSTHGLHCYTKHLGISSYVSLVCNSAWLYILHGRCPGHSSWILFWGPALALVLPARYHLQKQLKKEGNLYELCHKFIKISTLGPPPNSVKHLNNCLKHEKKAQITQTITQGGKDGQNSGAPNVNLRKISVGKTIWDLEFSEHLL